MTGNSYRSTHTSSQIIQENRRSNLSLAQIYNCLGKDNATQVIENILKHEVDINYRVPAQSGWTYDKPEFLGSTALHLAVVKNDIKSFKLLLDCGADFTIKDDKGFTALHRVIDKLDKDSTDFWEDLTGNQFINATISAHIKFENYVNPCDNNGLSHFHVACMTNNTEVVEFFLKNGVQVDQAVDPKSSAFAGWTPLHFAARSYSSESVKLLLDYNSDRLLRNFSKMTAMDLMVHWKVYLLRSLTINFEKEYSVKRVKTEIDKIEEILQLLTVCDVEKNFHTTSVDTFHAICSMQKPSTCKCFTDFLSNPYYRNVKAPYQKPIRTALHYAAWCNIEMAKLLTLNGHDMAFPSPHTLSPFGIFINNHGVEDVYAILNLVPNWKDICFAHGEGRLSDIILAMRDSDEFNAYLRNVVININVPIIEESPVFAGFTSLHLAVLFSERFKGDNDPLTLVELCLQRGADVTYQDPQGWTPIHLAYCQRKIKISQLLLNHQRALKNPINEDGLSHLHIACALKNNRLVRDLVEHVDVNVVYKSYKSDSDKSIRLGYTPLHVAVGSGCSEIVDLLIKRGADINARDGDGWTPIHRAFLSLETQKIVEILISEPGLENHVVDKLELSHLHVACSVDNAVAVGKLLDLGANINAQIVYDETGMDSNMKIPNLKPFADFTPLDIAVESNSTKVVELLLQRGADILAKDPSGSILLISMLTREDKTYEALFLSKLWGDKDLQKRLETEMGISMLHIACYTFNLEAIAELLKTDIDVNMQVPASSYTWAGRTPLHLFLFKAALDSMRNYEATLRMLLDKGASVTLADIKGYTPIHIYSTYGGDRSQLRLLLDRQIDYTLNPTSPDGISHFHSACIVNYVDVMKKFLESCKIDVNQPIDMYFNGDDAGCSTIDMALSSYVRNLYGIQSQLETVELLLKYGADARTEDVLGTTPLHSIANDGPSRVQLFQKFVEHGAFGNYRNSAGETPFEMLLKAGNVLVEEIEFFLRHNCQVNCFNPVSDEGYMSMFISKRYHENFQRKAFDKVIKASQRCLRNEEGRTVIHNIVACAEVLISVKKYVELIDKFVKLGIDVDEQDESGKTALHIAAYFGNEKATAALLRAGADVNIVDEDEKSAFSFAIESTTNSATRQKVIKYLATHVYKLKFFKLDVSQLNENLLKDNAPNVNSKFTDQLNECHETKRDSIDLRGFLSETGTVAGYCSMMLSERVKIDKFFESFYKDYELNDLKGILILQYRKAVTRLRLNRPSIQTLGYLFDWQLPDVSCRTIVRCLSNSNLKELIGSTPEEDDECKMDVD